MKIITVGLSSSHMMAHPQPSSSRCAPLLFVLGMLIIGLTSSSMNAQTNVSGIISSSTTWTLANSPYIVTGNVLVNNGVTLTIEPGVTVKFDTLKALQINGQLTARGNNSKSITFTSSKSVPAAGDWGYIFFSNSSTDAVFDASGNYTRGSILEYCVVEHAGNGATNHGAVEMTSSYPFINYCTIRNNIKSGLYASSLTDSLRITNNTISNNTTRYAPQEDGGGGGISASGGTVIISNNSIRNNSSTSAGNGGGIYISSGTPIITSNTISNNMAAMNGGAVYLKSDSGAIIAHNIISGNTADLEFGGIYTLFGTARIWDNFVINNQGGINIYYGSATITNNCISGNTAPYAGGGIRIRGAAATISNNVISDNAVKYDITYDRDGGGISLNEGNGSTVTITKNSIIRNSAKNASALDYPIAFMERSYDTVNVAYNTITGNKTTNPAPTYTNRITYCSLFTFNNISNNTATYELYNGNKNSSPTMNASENWWGTIADAKIQGKIYDWFDDASLGIVDASKYLTTPHPLAPISPPTNVLKRSLGGGQVKLTWNRNPEADIAGYHLYRGNFTGYSFTSIIDVGNDTSYTLTGVPITDIIAITAYDKTYSPANENGSTIVNDNMTNGNESWYAYAVDPAASTGVSLHDNTIAMIYTLQQNYPNPFNPSTTISYSLPKAAVVSVRIFNTLGQEVALLVNQQKDAGYYQIQWNANAPSGIYFYRLQAGEYTNTKKMLLLR